MAKDPVCGMEVNEKAANVMSRAGETVYYFCCPHCKSRFDKNPKKFTME